MKAGTAVEARAAGPRQAGGSGAVSGAALLALALQALAGWPAWHWWLSRVGDGSDEPWGVLAVLALLVLGGAAALRIPPRTGHLLALAALDVGLALAAPRLPPLLHAAGFLLGLVSLLAPPGRTGHEGRAGAWALALLSLPVLASVQFYLGYPLRLLAASLATPALRLAGLPVARVGLDLRLGEHVVQVDAPCSGARMLWVGLFLAAVLARAWGLSAARTVAACGLAVGAVLLGNAMRVSALALVETARLPGPPWLRPALHEAVGVAAFLPVALAILACAASLRSPRLPPAQVPVSA
jgi:exosortase/archaeosortase family protein